MKRTIRIIVPVLMVLTILLGSAWYFFVYDRALTRDLLLDAARFFDKNGQSRISAWFYDCAYAQAGNDDTVAIELADQYISTGNYTQAERVLQKAINGKPTTKLYIKLCNVFIEQDKVLDAVQLLDNIQDPSIILQMKTLRPKAPIATLQSGQYNQYMDVSFEDSNGTLYVNTNKEYPSVTEDLYSKPIRLAGGENHVYAVCIAENGLVSTLSKYAYTILDVIEQITVKDSLLDAEIRNILHFSADEPIYSDDLWAIEKLTIPEGTESFDEITHLRSLRELTILGGDGDLTVLQNLSRLKILNINNIDISDSELKIIGNLAELESLTLNKCFLGTTEGLENATNLQQLDLSNNTIRSITALQNLTALKKLILHRNVVEDLSPLSGCNALTYLDVSFNALTTLEPIYNLTSLETLIADENEIDVLGFTENFSDLQQLSLARNKIVDVSSIANCSGLKELDISGNEIFNISPLTELSNMIVLNFSNNSVSTIPTFDKESALAIIDGSGNKISSVSPLAGLENLTDVLMDNNIDITYVGDLLTCHSLIKVSVANTSVSSVGSLTERGIVVIK